MELKRDLENWTQIIEPRSKWYRLNLKEIWNYRDLILIFVKRDIVSMYKQTILGPLWFFLGPIFTVVVYTFVFNKIANISTENVPAPLFYLAGTTLWNYFQQCFLGTSSTFISNSAIFGKVYFPRLVSPISIIISNLLKFGISFLLFLCFWLYYYLNGDISPNIYLLLIPYLIFLMAGIALGSGVIISSLTTKYRDLSYFISFGITLIMYASPVIYPLSAIPDIYKPYIIYNPLAPIIETFRFAFTNSGSFSWIGIIYSTFFMLIVLATGTILFNKTEKTFMDSV